MVFVKYLCRPEDEKASLSVRMTTSQPTLSITTLNTSSPTPVIEIQLHIRCTSSVRPDRPLTFCTFDSIFDTTKPEHGHMDNLARGMLGPGLVCGNTSDNTRKAISLGFFHVHRARQDNDNAINLRERPGFQFITVPAQESGRELTVTHSLSSERLFAYAEKISPQDLKVGEKYEIRLVDGYMGTIWWCWGDLDTDLKGKKLHSFSEGFCVTGSEERPTDEEMEKEGWVIGEDVTQFRFRLEPDGGNCDVEVVE